MKRKVGAELIVGDVVRDEYNSIQLIVEVIDSENPEMRRIYLNARCADPWNGHQSDYVPFLKATFYDVYGNFPDLVEMAAARSVIETTLYNAWCLKRDTYLSEVYY